MTIEQSRKGVLYHPPRWLEPLTGVEPALSAWEADVLPLNNSGVSPTHFREQHPGGRAVRLLRGVRLKKDDPPSGEASWTRTNDLRQHPRPAVYPTLYQLSYCLINKSPGPGVRSGAFKFQISCVSPRVTAQSEARGVPSDPPSVCHFRGAIHMGVLRKLAPRKGQRSHIRFYHGDLCASLRRVEHPGIEPGTLQLYQLS